jgi:hypothetical protein
MPLLPTQHFMHAAFAATLGEKAHTKMRSALVTPPKWPRMIIISGAKPRRTEEDRCQFPQP